jgi:hypothetical protein
MNSKNFKTRKIIFVAGISLILIVFVIYFYINKPRVVIKPLTNSKIFNIDLRSNNNFVSAQLYLLYSFGDYIFENIHHINLYYLDNEFIFGTDYLNQTVYQFNDKSSTLPNVSGLYIYCNDTLYKCSENNCCIEAKGGLTSTLDIKKILDSIRSSVKSNSNLLRSIKVKEIYNKSTIIDIIVLNDSQTRELFKSIINKHYYLPMIIRSLLWNYRKKDIKFYIKLIANISSSTNSLKELVLNFYIFDRDSLHLLANLTLKANFNNISKNQILLQIKSFKKYINKNISFCGTFY